MYREEYAAYVTLIQQRLSAKRFVHSMNVAKEAVLLARRCGADEKKAYLAGVLHDVMKEESPQVQMAVMRRAPEPWDPVTLSARPLWHAKAGAVFCQQELGITDRDVLNAIAYHTTARANMSPLEIALYLADYIGEDRHYDDVDIMRDKTRRSIHEGMRYALIYTITDLARRGKAIHADTLGAYNQVVLSERKDDSCEQK